MKGNIETDTALYVLNFNHGNMQFSRTDIGGGFVRNCTIWGVGRRIKTSYCWSSTSNVFEKNFWLLYFSLLKMLVNSVTVGFAFGRPFAKLRKATSGFVISFCLPVRPSVHPSVSLYTWNKSATSGGIFMKCDIWGFFENLKRKFKFH